MIGYDEQKYLSQFESEMLDSYQCDFARAVPQYEPNILLPWRHTVFQITSILMALLGTFSVLHCYLPMVPDLNDLASTLIKMLGRVHGPVQCH